VGNYLTVPLRGRGVREMRKRTIHLIFAAAVLACLIHPSASEGQEQYTFVRAWPDGVPGFSSPCCVAVNAAGYVYVADTRNDRIIELSPGGDVLLCWGTEGFGDGQFSSPYGIAVDRVGNVYVADENNSRIQKFTSDGVFLAKWGVAGTSDGQFIGPYGIAVDRAGSVYVADESNSRIQKFTSDGVFLAKWGSQGRGDGQFDSPSGIAVDSTGNVYVADTFNSRIQKFTSDGVFLAKWGKSGHGDGQFSSPYGIAVDSAGNVYVADTGNYRIQKFTSDGVFLTEFGRSGWRRGELCYPTGIAVDRFLNVYVSDTGNQRIQKSRPANLSVESMGKLTVSWSGVRNGCNDAKRYPRYGFFLGQNFPNPFNPETWIPYQLKEGNRVTIQIYDITGNLVYRLDLGYKPAGSYMTKSRAAYWDGRNKVGEYVSSDVYFYTIQAGSYAATRKMVVAR
jgi:DNA-binding beta-propeller fold protein YncE